MVVIFFSGLDQFKLSFIGKGGLVILMAGLSNQPSFPSWDIDNSMVMSWLLHSMEPSLVEIYLLYPTAKAIWDAVHISYSDLEDSS